MAGLASAQSAIYFTSCSRDLQDILVIFQPLRSFQFHTLNLPLQHRLAVTTLLLNPHASRLVLSLFIPT